MNDSGDIFYVDQDGMPEGVVDIDAMTRRAKQTAARLAIASSEVDEVAAVIERELSHADLPPMLKLVYSNLVIQELTNEFFGPLLTFARTQNLDHDFIAELREHAGRDLDSGTPSDSSSAEQDSPDSGATAAEGR